MPDPAAASHGVALAAGSWRRTFLATRVVPSGRGFGTPVFPSEGPAMPKPITCRVRQFSPRHLTQLVRLEEHCQPDPYARWRWAEFRDACTLPHHRLLVALDDGGAVVAFVAFVDEAAVVRVLSQAGTAAGQRALQTEVFDLAGSRVVMWPGGAL